MSISYSSSSLSPRKAIVRAGFKAFWERGYSGTSLTDILSSSGTTKGGCYHHFSSKADLMRAVVKEETQPWIVRTWIDPIERSRDVIDGAQQLFRSYAQTAPKGLLQFGSPLSALSQELNSANHKAILKELELCYRSWRSSLVKVFERGKKKKQVRPDLRCEHLSLYLITSIEGAVCVAKGLSDAEPLVSTFKGLADYLGGLRFERYQKLRAE